MAGATHWGLLSGAEEGYYCLRSRGAVEGCVRNWRVQDKNGKRDKWLLLIAILKVIKAVMLLAVAIGAISMLHRDVAEGVYGWIQRLNEDIKTPFLQSLPSKMESLTPGKLTLVSIGTFVYSALFFTEGIGLFLQKRWAEYFTAVITASFIPFEIYELVAREFSVLKLALLFANVAILIYLVWRLRHERKNR
jgi:uncharacterized membrane protein (DUF2068 family)